MKNVPSALNIDLDKVVFLCEGYSNSDLKELCRNALMIPVREAIREAKELDSQAEIKKLRVRPIVLQDFLDCMDSLSHSLMTMSTVVPAEID